VARAQEGEYRRQEYRFRRTYDERIIAIMAGRLHLSTHQCIDSYRTLADDVFERTKLFCLRGTGEFKGVYSSLALEEGIKATLARRGLPENELLASFPVPRVVRPTGSDQADHDCKVSVYLL
jgi:hypothetical protein